MNWKYVITIGVLLFVVVGSIIYFNNNRPECYITNKNSCMLEYDKINFEMNYWDKDFKDEYGNFSLGWIQCCKRPHYLLQTIEPTLYVMKNFCEEVNKTQYYNKNGTK